MKVILSADVKGLGRVGDVKEVADGYFRNVLWPKNLAVPATPQALVELEENKARALARKEKLILELKNRIPEIQKLILEFPVKTGQKGEIFGSITKKDIKLALSEKGLEDIEVELVHPLKTLGEHEIGLDLGEGVKTKLKIALKKSTND